MTIICHGQKKQRRIAALGIEWGVRGGIDIGDEKFIPAS
jgi:hypothetical protein